MRDEMSRIAGIFEQQSVQAPDPARKTQHIQTAMDTFGLEHLVEKTPADQGTEIEERQRVQGNKTALFQNWRHSMTLLLDHSNRGLRYLAAGGVAASVIGAAIVAVGPAQLLPGLVQIEGDFGSVIDDAEGLENSQAANGQNSLIVPQVNYTSPATGQRSSVQQPNPNAQFNDRTFAPVIAPSPTQTVEKQGMPIQAGAEHHKREEALALGLRADHWTYQDHNRFAKLVPNPVQQVSQNPVSTFSVDVDTAAYGFLRRQLNDGALPNPNTIRIEELINYFDYDYAVPETTEVPFSVDTAIVPTPWNDNTQILRIGIQGYEASIAERPTANLVFLIDTSGSMDMPDKLPLLKNAFRLLLNTLGPNDTVSIVTYAGSAGLALNAVLANDKARILNALDQLGAGGSTAGGQGIELAYRVAAQHQLENGINRVILATDGDFNVGISDPDDLKTFIEDKRESGITLSILGFGQDNYQDELMQSLAQNGNGNAAYIDTLNEARKVLVEEVGGTLFTIAKDVKLQLEFNPAVVSEYRLIGYETRMLKREDFNNDKVDAGDIGAGHTVTALYEITPAGNPGRVDPLRYQSTSNTVQDSTNEYGFLRIRYKQPNSDESQLIETPITKDQLAATIDEAPASARFAIAVAGFGELLRGGRNLENFDLDSVLTLGQSARGEDRSGYRGEFLRLVELAKALRN